MLFFTLGSSKIEVSETYFFDIVITQYDHPRYVKHILGRVYVFFTLFGYWVRGGGGGGSLGIGTQLAYAISTLVSSKIVVSETYFFDIVITQYDHPGCIKHILGRIYVLFTLFGYWAWGGGVKWYWYTFSACTAQNRSFRNLFFCYCDHLKWPSKVCKACFSPYLCHFYRILGVCRLG